MAKKLTRTEASKLRERYLAQKQELLMADVDQLGLTLYDKIYNDYLIQLEQVGGKLIMNNKNLSLVQGLDLIYKNFAVKYNAPTVKKFVVDAQGLPEINATYFNTVQTKPTTTALSKAISATNKGLGITKEGKVIKNGFVDKFLRDETILKRIKTDTVQAITQGKGFQQFRNELKVTIQGESGKPLSGQLQQYYRNNAYDTMHKVDRLASDTFAEELGMQYFIYTGGEITTSREFCKYCNSKIVFAPEFAKLKYKQLKTKYRSGLPNGKSAEWNPLEQLGGFGCIHRKDYIDNDLAQTMKDRWLKISVLKG